MLKITIPSFELFDYSKNEFVTCKETELALEHSLVSISKWEQKWKKPIPFINPTLNQEITKAQLYDYIRCMTLTQNVDPIVYTGLTATNLKTILNYMKEPMTATWFSNDRPEGAPPSRKIITSEVIYGWMVGLQIPFECQKWHINRLLTLIRVCGENNKPPQKMDKAASMAAHRRLNAARRKPRKR